MSHQLETGIAHQVRDIVLRTRVEVVHAENFMTLTDQAFAQVRAEEPGTPGYQDAFVNAIALHAVSSVYCAANV